MDFDHLNSWLDTLPRTRFGALVKRAPIFGSCGWIGYYFALFVVMVLGFATGRSLPLLMLLALVCAASFFVYAYVRRWIAKREELVLLEHVWFALACSAGTLWAVHRPLLPNLDVIAAALPFFLASGRCGCFLVGCCHGLPCEIGVCYGDQHVREGFPNAWQGVRLFPVQLLEALGLLLIGVISCFFVLFARPATAFWFFLCGYGAFRFALESLRGDVRPHLLGVSQSRWMALAEVAAVLSTTRHLAEERIPLVALAAAAVVAVAHRAYRTRYGWRARLLEAAHLNEIRELARSDERPGPIAARSRLGVSVACSHGGRCVSLRLPEPRFDLPLLCELATAAFPELETHSAQVGCERGVLLFECPVPRAPERAHPAPGLARQLYGRAAFAAQREQTAKAPEAPPEATADAARVHYFTSPKARNG